MDNVVQELAFIKWLLVALIVIVVLTMLVILGFLNGLKELSSDSRLESQAFKAQAEDYDNQSRYKSLRSLCERRLKKFNNDKWALYYLGIASLRLEDYAAAKAHFNRIRKLDPNWEESVVAYLDEIDEHLKQNPPKPV